MDKNKEYILCSAVWFDDGIEHVHQPKNIKTGYVVCGRRHHNCFYTAGTLDKERGYIKYEKEQGFITNLDRFVDRKEGAEIAFKSNKIKEEKEQLYSEDLY